MTNNEKRVGKKLSIIAICSVVTIVIIVLAVFILIGHSSSNDIVVTAQTHYSGLTCQDKTLRHPVLTDYNPISFTNTISAVFSDAGISSITYQYDGTYSSAEDAKDAEAFAAADYNTFLAKEYNVDIEIFSHNFRRNGENLSLTITAQADDIPQKTLPYFLLDNTSSLPKNAEALIKIYKDKGFSCRETK